MYVVKDLGPADAALPTPASTAVPTSEVIETASSAESAYLANPTEQNQYITTIEPVNANEAAYLANPNDATQNNIEAADATPLTSAEAAYLANPTDVNQEIVESTNEPLTPAEAAYLANPSEQNQDFVENGTPEPLTDAEAAYLANPNAATQQRVQNQMAGEPGGYGSPYDDEGNLMPGWSLDENNDPVYVGNNTSDGSLFVEPATTAQAASDRAAAEKARLQQTIAQQRKAPNNGDWRVKLRLAPQANYLYKSENPGILQPLKVTDGIIFPYTPAIDMAYKANYTNYDLTHSNFRGYYYQNSYIDNINLRCLFTAQSTNEAEYLQAVIHFLRSATKMFYGQDAEAGSPPPIVYLTGLGQYQFNEHPCVINQFNYNLPADVDYIRANSPNINNTNLSLRKDKQTNFPGSSLLGGFLGGAVNRLLNAGLPKGGLSSPPTQGSLSVSNQATYVPTKMEISINLFPIQSRQQVSKQFSVKEFANGNLLRGGFW